MANWTERGLTKQFERVKKNGCIRFFKSAAERYQFPPEILLAIASRETNMRNIIGDGGHGYGIMQIDDRSFPEWCNSGLWKDVNASIQKGALVLHSKQQTIRNGQGKRLKVGSTPFVGKPHLAKTSSYALLSPPITLACGPTTISRGMGILIAGRPEGTTPKTY